MFVPYSPAKPNVQNWPLHTQNYTVRPMVAFCLVLEIPFTHSYTKCRTYNSASIHRMESHMRTTLH